MIIDPTFARVLQQIDLDGLVEEQGEQGGAASAGNEVLLDPSAGLKELGELLPRGRSAGDQVLLDPTAALRELEKLLPRARSAADALLFDPWAELKELGKLPHARSAGDEVLLDPSADLRELTEWLAGHSAASTQLNQDAGAAQREQEARKLKEGGGLSTPGPNPPASQKELDDLAQRINAADDDAAVAIARDPRAMAIATPQQKAALIRKLMDGHTNSDEEAAIKQILLSCKSRQELEQVVQMSGGIQEIADELDAGDLQAVVDHANQLAQKQDAAVEHAISLLEQAKSPEEFKRLYEELGGDQLKHKVSRPRAGSTQTRQSYLDQLGRLEALAQRYGVRGVGFGMPPEKTAALQDAIQKAIEEEDSDAIVRLSENAEAMNAASPAQKARMVAILQDGWTKDSQDMAIARILGSCNSKAEFDQVVDMAGGPAILEDVDYPEAKADINRTMGGFDRIDCADDKATAQAFRGTLLPPLVDQLASTRPPTDDEMREVLGPDAQADASPEAKRRFDAIRARMGKVAHDLEADPLARNKLALINRERQLRGQPPLDYTSLVTQAYKTANDPSFAADVERAIAQAEQQLGSLDEAQKQEIREQVLAQRLGAIAKEYGLSEQEMKTLVTAKMGRVMQEGANEVRAATADMVTSMQKQLAEVERTQGADSPEANRLRASLRKLVPAAQTWANRLQATGVTAASLFKVPPSFAEEFVKAISVVGDVLAAVVNVIPGVGQAISGAYFGVKAIVAAATGDVLGAFKNLLSAVPGFSGVFGAASATINTGAKVMQAGIAVGEGVASGNPLAFAGAMGGMAGSLGIDVGRFVPGGEVVQYAIRQGQAVGGVVDGVVRGDINAALNGIGGLSGTLRKFGSFGQRLADGVDLARRGVDTVEQIGAPTLPGVLRAAGADALATALDAIGASPAAHAFRQTIGHVARFVDAAGRNDVHALGEVLRQWMPELAAHTASKSVTKLADEARKLLRSPALVDARRVARSEAQDAQRQLERLAALRTSAVALRAFEDAAVEIGSRIDGDWQSAAADLPRRLGVR